MDRLKPCPFCGSKDIKLCGNHRDSFWFRCNKCASIDSYDTERQAVRAWNKRVAIPSAEPTEEQVKLYCRNRNLVLADSDFMVHIIKGTSKAYKGMTNGEVVKAVFPDIPRTLEWHIQNVTDDDWWNSPYEPQEISDRNLKMWHDIYKAESDHKCHNCKHYTSGERDGSCDSYICKNYSGWESED